MADYRRIARDAARKYGLDPDIFERQINQESGFRPHVSSPAGAQGIAQIMPATAQSWGVDPNKPKQALDAAAKHMAGYVKSYGGSYEKALAAYNAGPGNVAKYGGVPPFAETQHYVRTILNGRTPKTPAQVRRSSASPGQGWTTENRTVSQTIPGVDRSAQRRALLQQYLVDRGKPDALLSLGLGLREAQDTPARTTTKTVQVRTPQGGASPRRQSSGGGGGARGRPAQLKELFYNGPGGVNADEGRRVNRGFVSGHTDHVHVAAADHKTAVAIGKLAQKMGLSVRELEPFDKVDPVHTTNSFHYRGLAADVSGDPAKMAAFSRAVARRFGL